MGKAKPVKKAAQSPAKISTSLFQRKSKTSQGARQIDKKEATGSPKKSGKGSTSTATAASPKKGTKAKVTEASTSSGTKSPSKTVKGGKDVSSPAGPKKSVGKQQQKGGAGSKKTPEKRSTSPVPETKPEKKGKVTKASTKKGKVGTGKVTKAPVKVIAKKKKVVASKKLLTSSSSSSSSSSVTSSDGERERSTRSSASNSKKVPEKSRKSRESREDTSPSPSTRLRSPESEKVTTRKRSKSDSESPPPQKMAKVGEKGKGKTAGKKLPVKKKITKGETASKTTTKEVAKKVTKKAVASVVASKKKTVVKKVKKSTRMTSSSSSASSTTSSSSSSKAKDTSPVKKKPVRTGKPVAKPGKVVKVKAKAKPRTKVKLKRMASLNAKAILEASFSFEPSEKKQRSPAPSSSSTPQKSKSAGTSTEETTTTKGDTSHDVKPSTLSKSATVTSSSTSTGKGGAGSEPRMKDAAVSVSVSTSTSPTPPEMPESPKTFKKTPVPVKGEKKRKSTDASSSTGGSRRESTSSTKSSSKDVQTSSFSSQHNHVSVGTSTQTSTTPAPIIKREKSTGKAGSRRSSVATATSVDATPAVSPVGKGSKEKIGKKKQKMVAAATTTSTSTSTSPIPIPMWNEHCDVVVEKRVSVGTTATGTSTAPIPKQKKHRTASSGGRDKDQDSSSQGQQGQTSHHHSMSSSSNSSSSKHHKSASYQAKEKSSTPVAHYGSGTVYQPAGPLIEPHKQSSSVPAGILPETVRLPPDLKVTYQTHPPSSAFTSSGTEAQQQQHHHHHHHSTKASGSSKRSSSSKSEKSSAAASAGTILHQPYKSTPSSSSSPSNSRNVPSSYSSTGSGYASSTGTPLLSPSDVISNQHHPGPSASVGGGSVHGSHQSSSRSEGGSSSSLSMSAHHHPLHSVTPGGSITVGGVSSQQTGNPGAPSSSGLYYATNNYGHHNSPFAPVKYPLVPQESYRTQSPFPNSFLCPPTTPQPPSQSYFMTPFYTPPLTPNPPGGLGTVGPSQGRPLSHHHPAAAAAAAAAYYQQSGPLSHPSSAAAAAAAAAAAGLPASYYMASPQHHSIHPTPAPGHAGPFLRPNQSSQPACPCPTDSYPPSSNSTNSSTRPPPLQQRPSLSSGSQAPEAGAKQPKRQSHSPAQTASRPSRNSGKEGAHLQHPPTCRTPAVGADPPSAIQIIPTGDIHSSRQQLESAKTFTEQYSLPDDITITPIMPPNSSTNAALLMLNSSVSVILTSAPSTTTTTLTSTTSKSSMNHHNHQDGLLKLNNSCNTLPNKPKVKDIVHVIDPRSGQRTTIAKHISNNRFAGISDSSKSKAAQHHQHQQQQQSGGKHISGNMSIVVNNKANHRGPPNKTHNSRMETVRKLNPDLDVIVINRGELHRDDKIENIQSGSLSSPATHLPEKPLPHRAQLNQGQMLKQVPHQKQGGGRVAQNKIHPVPFSAISSSVMGLQQPGLQQGKRQALAHNGNNNFHRNNGNSVSPGSLLKANQRRGKNGSVPVANNKNIQSSNMYPSSTSTSASTTAFQMNYMPVLPPGISISAGSGGGADDMQPTNLSKKSYNNVNSTDFHPVPNRFHQVGQSTAYGPPKKQVKAIKRSLNECIDGLQLQQQQKKLKMLEQHHPSGAAVGGGRMNMYGNGPVNASARTAAYNVNGGKAVFPGMAVGRGASMSPQQFNQQQFYNNNNNKSRLSLPVQYPGMYNRETTTAARVRDPDFETRLGGMLINSTDAAAAVSALVEPFDYSMARQMGAHQRQMINANGLNRTNNPGGFGRGRGGAAASARHSAVGSYAFTEAKRKVNKLKRQQQEKASTSRGGGAVGSGAKSKVRTRLSVKPKGLHGNSTQPLGSRSRSRLLRKRSLLCTPNNNPAGNAGGNRRSESDSSICASRSSSSVRIIGAQPGSSRQGGKDRERERNTQAFINATADLYQYRRSVILRVPSPKPITAVTSLEVEGGEATAVSNLNRTVTADQIARFGDVSPSSSSAISGLSISIAEVGGNSSKEIPRELAAQQMAQLARTHILMSNLPVSLSPQAQQESKGPTVSPLPRTGSMVVNALKKRAGMKPLSPASVNGALNQQLLLNSRRQPRWSNGWRFEGEPYEAKVYVKNDDAPIARRCYPSMRHDGGDVIRTRDCVLLKSGPRKNDLPFIAKIAALWENPTDGEMMFSLLWYYRPEHTELGRTKDDMMDEIFASKHRDTNSVATIEDRCYVLTFNEYCRYRKRLKELEHGITRDSALVPFADTAMINTNTAAKIAEAVWSGISLDPSKNMTSGKVSPEVVFFCRKVYDFRQKRILKNPS